MYNSWPYFGIVTKKNLFKKLIFLGMATIGSRSRYIVSSLHNAHNKRQNIVRVVVLIWPHLSKIYYFKTIYFSITKKKTLHNQPVPDEEAKL